MSDTEHQDETREEEDVEEVMRRVEEDPPDKLEDWPSGKAKYKTMGGGEHETGWDDGPTSKLGPADVRHHEDGSVTVGGEKVDNPDDYKGEPIPGGPTDPDAPPDIAVTKSAMDGDGDRDSDDRDSES